METGRWWARTQGYPLDEMPGMCTQESLKEGHCVPIPLQGVQR
jgi:hypothetical protein